MRKKLIILIVGILVITILTSWYHSINMNELNGISIVNIDEITLHSPSDYYTITEQKDIQSIFEVLQSMHLSRTIHFPKDGFTYLIDIHLQDDQIIEMCILSKDIRINHHSYKPKRDYINDIQEIYNKLKLKYECNPT